jgi:hypothetical protein
MKYIVISGHHPNFDKIKCSSIPTAAATSTLVTVTSVPEASTKRSNETNMEAAAKSDCEAALPLSLKLPLSLLG